MPCFAWHPALPLSILCALQLRLWTKIIGHNAVWITSISAGVTYSWQNVFVSVRAGCFFQWKAAGTPVIHQKNGWKKDATGFPSRLKNALITPQLSPNEKVCLCELSSCRHSNKCRLSCNTRSFWDKISSANPHSRCVHASNHYDKATSPVDSSSCQLMSEASKERLQQHQQNWDFHKWPKGSNESSQSLLKMDSQSKVCGRQGMLDRIPLETIHTGLRQVQKQNPPGKIRSQSNLCKERVVSIQKDPKFTF